MKRILLLACFTLSAWFLASPAQANFKVDVGIKSWYRVTCGPFSCGSGLQAGPWYSYWPYEAHFMTPAPTGYPHFPGPQTLPLNGPSIPPMFSPGLQRIPNHQEGLKPAGYFEVPSYWYGR